MALVQHEDSWTPKDTFATRLLLVRRELELSQEEAAALCGLPTPTWAAWERNGDRQPRGLIDVVNKIATATGCSRDWLMWGNNNQSGCDHDTSGYQQVLFHADIAA